MLAQEIESAIDRRATDGRILAMYSRVNLLRRYVLLGLLDSLQNQLPLRREAVALGMKVSDKIGSG